MDFVIDKKTICLTQVLPKGRTQNFRTGSSLFITQISTATRAKLASRQI